MDLFSKTDRVHVEELRIEARKWLPILAGVIEKAEVENKEEFVSFAVKVIDGYMLHECYLGRGS